jgi:hypothetical protein
MVDKIKKKWMSHCSKMADETSRMTNEIPKWLTRLERGARSLSARLGARGLVQVRVGSVADAGAWVDSRVVAGCLVGWLANSVAYIYSEPSLILYVGCVDPPPLLRVEKIQKK